MLRMIPRASIKRTPTKDTTKCDSKRILGHQLSWPSPLSPLRHKDRLPQRLVRRPTRVGLLASLATLASFPHLTSRSVIGSMSVTVGAYVRVSANISFNHHLQGRQVTHLTSDVCGRYARHSVVACRCSRRGGTPTSAGTSRGNGSDTASTASTWAGGRLGGGDGAATGAGALSASSSPSISIYTT